MQDDSDDFKRLPRHCCTAIQTRRIFEHRVQKQEVVGQRFVASQRRKPEFMQAQLSARQLRPTDTQERLESHDLDSSAPDEQDSEAAVARRVIDPWYASHFWHTAAEVRADAPPGLRRRSTKTPRAQTARRPQSSRWSPPSSAPGSSEGAFGTTIRLEPLLPRPAVPKLPDAAAAACWPGGNARWRWPVPASTASPTSVPASASTAQTAVEDNFPDAPEDDQQLVEEVKRGPELHQPWWEIGA
eukprot:TRINITY_DN14791_c1_g1_i1.p1 TRINITY_DN14791_c1_g1~~TRINITY_DN14791_c1_g1_i1.p1  ORF type:complete len:243 (-),score=50.04 TRINITY_DN14791_c1_g1_i1:137-865(-)